MKKILMISGLFISGLSGSLFAQPVNNALVVDQAAFRMRGNYINTISTRAARDFVERFDNAAEAKWYKLDDGYMVRFTADSIQCKAVYDRRGHWLYTIKFLEEAGMPYAVRDIVKRTYYDYTITQVEEIEQPGQKKVYLVHMQDAVSWKNVRVCNGEMELVEDYKKG